MKLTLPPPATTTAADMARLKAGRQAQLFRQALRLDPEAQRAPNENSADAADLWFADIIGSASDNFLTVAFSDLKPAHRWLVNISGLPRGFRVRIRKGPNYIVGTWLHWELVAKTTTPPQP